MNKKSRGVNSVFCAKSRGIYMHNHTDYTDNKQIKQLANISGATTSSSNVISVFKLVRKKFPNLTDKKINKYYNTYCQAIRQQLIKRLPFLSSSTTSISLNKLWYHRFEYDKVQYYIYREFNLLLPYFTILDLGRPETIKKKSIKKQQYKINTNNTIIMLNQKLIDQLIDTTDTTELVSYYYSDVDIDTLETVDVDMYSLNNFINKTLLELEKGHNQKHIDKLYRNYRQAKYIKIISEFFYSAYNKHVLPQIPVKSKYGRTYYKGINIQNISTEVRQAVIGEHYSYDLNAAVYSIKLMLARKILSEMNQLDYGLFTYTKEYLDHKSAIRIQLAKHIHAYDKFGKYVSKTESIKLVKQAMTAIGFGARISGGSWKVDENWHTPTLHEIIKNPEDRNNFIKDAFVQEFVKEQHQLTHFITNHYISDSEFTNSLLHIPNMYKNNRIRKSQVMAYLFQQVESQILNVITENIPVVAKIHDCYITKNKLSSTQLTEIKTKLLHMDQDLSLTETYYSGWHDPYMEIDIQNHKQFVEQQEQLLRDLNLSPLRRKSMLTLEYI